MLSSNKIKLRPLELDDAELLRSWRFAEENYSYFYEFTPVSKCQNEAWLQNTLKKTSELNFIITEKAHNEDIGMISLIDIDMRSQKCEMGRVLIGESKFKGQGLGSDAIRTLLNYAFNHLNMHKVYCEVFADNEIALKLYEKCGFVKDGLFLKHVYKSGEFKDIIHMSIIK